MSGCDQHFKSRRQLRVRLHDYAKSVCISNIDLSHIHREGFFQCHTGDCIHEDAVCSGHAECPDGSDESQQVCATHFCPEPAFRCDYGACVLRTARCDGQMDCVDGSDERYELCGDVGPNDTRKVVQPGAFVTGISSQNSQVNALGGRNPQISNNFRALIAAYRRLLLRLELQIVELQQENIRLRLGSGDSGFDDLSVDDELQLDAINGRNVSSQIRNPPSSDLPDTIGQDGKFDVIW